MTKAIKPQMTPAQMERIAAEYRANGYDATVTANGRHVVAINHPEWMKAMLANTAT